jgi:CHAT domain-containing protein/tetratricopeptide (TPR) repeat protein
MGGPTQSAEFASAFAKDYAAGNYAAARGNATKAVQASVTQPRTNRGETAVALSLVGRACMALRQTEKTKGVLEEALKRAREAGPSWAKAVAAILDAKGQLQRHLGNYEPAARAFEEALSIFQSSPQNGRDTARTLNQLGLVREEMGDEEAALQLYQRALDVGRTAAGGNDAELATTLVNIGGLQRRLGHLKDAKASLEGASEFEGRAGSGNPERTAALANQWGLLQHEAGNPNGAERHFRDAIADAVNSVLAASARNNLALLDRDRGDIETATELLEKAAADQARIEGATPRTATLLHNLADTYSMAGRSNCAGTLYRQAIGIWSRRFGSDHPDIVRASIGLAEIDRRQGNFADAAAQLRSALDRLERRLGPNNPQVARTRNNLAEALRLDGREGDAAALYESARSDLESAYGARHPDIATVIMNQAVLAWQTGATGDATRLATDAVTRRDHTAGIMLTSGSDEQKLEFAHTLAGETAALVSLQTATPRDPAAAALALRTVLERKGRALDEAATILALAGRQDDPATRGLLNEWRAARSNLAKLYFAAGGAEADSTRIRVAETQVQEIESRLGQQTSAIKRVADQVDLDALRARIPAAAVLIEFTYYAPFTPLGRGVVPAHYGAFLERREGSGAFIDLGDAASIDDDVLHLIRAMSYCGSPCPEKRDLAVRLNDRLIGPLLQFIGDARMLLISPDGNLNALSFALLQDREGRSLLQRHDLAYLDTGRDLMRARETVGRQDPPLVLGDPEYGLPGPGTCSFKPLPWTATEAAAIARILPDARLLTGRAASKDALRAVHGPKILVLGTHAFFPDDGPDICGAGVVRAGERHDLVAWSLLRSGLVLAGGNESPERGLLTAFEMAEMDLHSTELVVLSACGTGRGVIEEGEGVLGLRRALSFAGSETQVMSLWPVDDEATSALMIRFYQMLASGAARSEALRAAQLEIAADPRWTDPKFWAAFIIVGAWTPLSTRG